MVSEGKSKVSFFNTLTCAEDYYSKPADLYWLRKGSKKGESQKTGKVKKIQTDQEERKGEGGKGKIKS